MGGGGRNPGRQKLCCLWQSWEQADRLQTAFCIGIMLCTCGVEVRRAVVCVCVGGLFPVLDTPVVVALSNNRMISSGKGKAHWYLYGGTDPKLNTRLLKFFKKSIAIVLLQSSILMYGCGELDYKEG